MKAIAILFALVLTINTHAALYKCEDPDAKLISFEEVPRIGCKTLDGKVMLTDEDVAGELVVQLNDASRKLQEEVDKITAASQKRQEIR